MKAGKTGDMAVRFACCAMFCATSQVGVLRLGQLVVAEPLLTALPALASSWSAGKSSDDLNAV
jgi:hypothetical protein